MPVNARAIFTLDTPLSPMPNRVVWYEATDDSPALTADSGGHVSKQPSMGKKHKLLVGHPNAVPPGATVSIDISIMDSTGTQAMTPLGIALRHAGGAGPGHDPQGQDDFPVVTISDKVLTLTAAAKVRGRWYQFDVLFKDANGNLGLLDPTIMNN